MTERDYFKWDISGLGRLGEILGRTREVADNIAFPPYDQRKLQWLNLVVIYLISQTALSGQFTMKFVSQALFHLSSARGMLL